MQDTIILIGLLISFIFTGIVGITTDTKNSKNSNGNFVSGIGICIMCFLSAFLAFGFVWLRESPKLIEDGYKKGQIDYQNGIIKYKKQVNIVKDTTYVLTNFNIKIK